LEEESKFPKVKKFLLGLAIGIGIEIALISMIGLVPFSVWGNWGNAHFSDIVVTYPVAISILITALLFFMKKSYKLGLGILVGIILPLLLFTLFLTVASYAGYQADF